MRLQRASAYVVSIRRALVLQHKPNARYNHLVVERDSERVSERERESEREGEREPQLINPLLG
jgi:hypothetical protein